MGKPTSFDEVTYPALPPASMWLASVTSLDHTSNCHFLRPKTPQWTLPLWIPTLMLTFTPVTSRTSLERDMGDKGHHWQLNGCSQQHKLASRTQESIMVHKLFTDTHSAAHPHQQDNRTKLDELFCSWMARLAKKSPNLNMELLD